MCAQSVLVSSTSDLSCQVIERQQAGLVALREQLHDARQREVISEDVHMMAVWLMRDGRT